MAMRIIKGKTHFSNISIDDDGKGQPPVIFLHSLAGNAMHWSSQLEHIRRSNRGIAIETPGHGRSPPPEDKDYSVQSLARCIDVVVSNLDLKGFVLVGHSFGASLAIQYASTNPENVLGLLLVDPSGDLRKMPSDEVKGYIDLLESESYSQAIESYWKTLLSSSRPDVEEMVFTDMLNTQKDTIINIFKSYLSFDPISAIMDYHGRKLSIITPQNDLPFSLHNLVDDLPHITIHGTGHWLQMDKPDLFNQILDEFIASI